MPKYIYDEDIAGKFPYDIKDTFMGFHCGNTPSCKMCGGCAVKYQLIQNRLLENGGTPDFTRGTLEGDIAPGEITFYRLQCDSEGELRAYVAEGEVLPVATRSFGGIGIFAIPITARWPSPTAARRSSKSSSTSASATSPTTSPRACPTQRRIPGAERRTSFPRKRKERRPERDAALLLMRAERFCASNQGKGTEGGGTHILPVEEFGGDGTA